MSLDEFTVMLWVEEATLVGENVAALRGLKKEGRTEQADDLRSLGKKRGRPYLLWLGLGITPHKG